MHHLAAHLAQRRSVGLRDRAIVSRAGRDHQREIRIDEGGHDHLAGGVDFGGAPGRGEILQTPGGTDLFDDPVANQQGPVGNDIEFTHGGPAAESGRPVQREQLPGVPDQRPFIGRRLRVCNLHQK